MTKISTMEVACETNNYGVYDQNTFLQKIREHTAYATNYIENSPNCVVNEPTAEPTPGPAPTKKASKK